MFDKDSIVDKCIWYYFLVG